MSNSALDASPEILTGSIRIGQGRTWTCTDESGNGWPASTRLIIEDHAGAEQTLTPTIAGTLATWSVTVAEAAALRGTKTTGSLRATITTGTGDALRPVKAGRLSIISKWDGVRSAQSLGTVTLGPMGESLIFTEDGTGGLTITAGVNTTLTEDGTGGLEVTIS